MKVHVARRGHLGQMGLKELTNDFVPLPPSKSRYKSSYHKLHVSPYLGRISVWPRVDCWPFQIRFSFFLWWDVSWRSENDEPLTRWLGSIGTFQYFDVLEGFSRWQRKTIMVVSFKLKEISKRLHYERNEDEWKWNKLFLYFYNNNFSDFYWS